MTFWITNLFFLLLFIAFFVVAIIIEKFSFKIFTIKNIVIMSMLVSITSVLNVIGYNAFGTLKLSLGHPILFLIGMVFGPIASLLGALSCDLISFLIMPSGIYHLGFLFAKVLISFFGSLVFITRKYNKYWVIWLWFLFIISLSIVNLFIDTFTLIWSGYITLASVNFIIKLIILPIECIVFPMLTLGCFRVVYVLIEKDYYTLNKQWCLEYFKNKSRT